MENLSVSEQETLGEVALFGVALPVIHLLCCMLVKRGSEQAAEKSYLESTASQGITLLKDILARES